MTAKIIAGIVVVWAALIIWILHEAWTAPILEEGVDYTELSAFDDDEKEVKNNCLSD